MSVIKHYVNRYREKVSSVLWSSGLLPGAESGLKRSVKLKDKYEGERVFLIGNGPSINEQDLSLLVGEYTFACNSFFLKCEDIGLSPTFYVVEDKFVAEDNSQKLKSINYSRKVFPIDLRYCLRDENSLFVDFQRYYMRSNKSDFPRFWREESPLRFYWGGTVIYFAIQLAAFMGFKQIYLIGIDLNYKIPKNIVRAGDKLTSLEDDSNHFHPDYFGKGKRWHLPETERMQHCFEKAYTECTSIGVNLLNATHGGNLAVIPRVEYASLF